MPGTSGLRGRSGRMLGHDLLGAIFALLDAKDLSSVDQTCHQWREAVDHCGLWCHHALVAWEMRLPFVLIEPPKQENTSFDDDAPLPSHYMQPPPSGDQWRQKFLAIARWRRTIYSCGRQTTCLVRARRQHMRTSRRLDEADSSVLGDSTNATGGADIRESGYTSQRVTTHEHVYCLPTVSSGYGHESIQVIPDEHPRPLQAYNLPHFEGCTAAALCAGVEDTVALCDAHPRVLRLWDLRRKFLKSTVVLPTRLEVATFAAPRQLLTQGQGHLVLWRNGRAAHRFPVLAAKGNQSTALLAAADGIVAECSSHGGAGIIRVYDLYSGRLSRVLRPTYLSGISDHSGRSIAALHLAEGGLGSAGAVLASASGRCLSVNAADSGQQMVCCEVPRSQGQGTGGSGWRAFDNRTVAFDAGTHRLLYATNFSDLGCGAFDVRKPDHPLWCGIGPSMHLLLPPWGCSDVALLLPSRTEVWGADFNHRHRANVVDLASGSVIWQFDLWHPKADRLLSTGFLKDTKLRAIRQRQRIAPELIMPHPLPDPPPSVFRTSLIGGGGRPPLDHCLPLVLSGHIITAWEDFGPSAWALPTWQQLSSPKKLRNDCP